MLFSLVISHFQYSVLKDVNEFFPSLQNLALNRSLKRISIKELRFILPSGNNLIMLSPIKIESQWIVFELINK